MSDSAATFEEAIGCLGDTLTEAERREFADAFKRALFLELVCGPGLPAEYRRAILREELRTLDDAASESLLECVLGRLDHHDELVVLMAGG